MVPGRCGLPGVGGEDDPHQPQQHGADAGREGPPSSSPSNRALSSDPGYRPHRVLSVLLVAQASSRPSVRVGRPAWRGPQTSSAGGAFDPLSRNSLIFGPRWSRGCARVVLVPGGGRDPGQTRLRTRRHEPACVPSMRCEGRCDSTRRDGGRLARSTASFRWMMLMHSSRPLVLSCFLRQYGAYARVRLCEHQERLSVYQVGHRGRGPLTARARTRSRLAGRLPGTCCADRGELTD